MLRKRLVAITVLVLGTFLFSSSVYANYFGGKWAYNIAYYAGNLGFQRDSAIGWNNVTTNRKWYETSYTYAVVIGNYVKYGDVGWNAMGIPGPDPYSGTYSYGTLKYNQTYMDGYNYDKKVAISMHELGHIMGLAHNSDSTASNPSIMYEGGSSIYYDQWGVIYPTTRDTTDINNLYPKEG